MEAMDSKEVHLLLYFVPPPLGHGVEVRPGHAKGELKILRTEVPLQVAPVYVGGQLVVGGEEHVERVDLVLSRKRGGRPRPGGDGVAGQGRGGVR